MRLDDLARRLGLEFEGEPSTEISALAPLSEAGTGELTFVSGERLSAQYAASRAGAAILPPEFDSLGRACLRSAAPYAEFARAVELFHPRPSPPPGVHPTAVVDPGAELGEGVSVGAYVVIGEGARIGDRSCLYPHVTVYPGVSIGADCRIHSGVHLREEVRLGDRVIVQSGAVIGGEGFGFAPTAEGARVRVPHRTGVEIGDDCEIGSNTTIDAAHPAHPRHGHAVARTRLGERVAVDNLVQIGHGCWLEDDVTICALVGLGGTTEVGRGAVMGGVSASAGHLRVGAGARVGGGTGVRGDVGDGEEVLGYTHMPARIYRRSWAAFKRLPELLRRVRRIEQRLKLGGETD